MADEKVVVHVVAAVWGLSSASPFCVKLETWLRMAQIPFELQSLRGKTKSGDRDFCFDEPSSIDAVAYGFFAGILAAPINDRLKQAVESHDNLVQFCARMKARYFAEGLSS